MFVHDISSIEYDLESKNDQKPYFWFLGCRETFSNLPTHLPPPVSVILDHIYHHVTRSFNILCECIHSNSYISISIIAHFEWPYYIYQEYVNVGYVNVDFETLDVDAPPSLWFR